MGLWYLEVILRHSSTVIVRGQFNHEIIYHRSFVTSPSRKLCVMEVPNGNI